MNGEERKYWMKWEEIRNGGPSWKERHLLEARNLFTAHLTALQLNMTPG